MKKLIKWIHKFWTHTYIVTIYRDGILQWTVKGWVKRKLNQNKDE